jgi:PepSY-associated TM region
VSSVELQRKFNSEYPWVNRLLPVYKIGFDDEQGITVFIHTETAALASINNESKRDMQTVFRVLHTWSWLEATGHARVIFALFNLTLFAMAASGIALLVTLKQRKIPDSSRRRHRALAYLIGIPLLAWSASGFYHLIQSAYVQPISGIRLSEPVDLSDLPAGDSQWFERFQSQGLNAVSIVRSELGLLYRLSIANGKTKEKRSVYVSATTGDSVEVNDQSQALWLAKQHLGFSDELISQCQLITRFGPGYDFRNKRLPVWQIDYANSETLRVFIDPATGILVDQNRKIDRLESLSFSLLHKWNFLRPLFGKVWRDGVVLFFLMLCLAAVAFGLKVWLNLETAVGSRKSAQVLDAPDKF